MPPTNGGLELASSAIEDSERTVRGIPMPFEKIQTLTDTNFDETVIKSTAPYSSISGPNGAPRAVT